jgi:hypothetical protein
VSVKDFGAVGNGVANDTAAIQATITYAAANSPCKVIFPTGTYKCNAVLGSFTGSNIEIDFQNSVLDFTAIGLSETGPLLEFTGNYSTNTALTSNALSETKSIAANSSSFVAGDMVRIYSETIWDSTRTNTRIGEINFVETVPNASSINLTTEMQSNYTTAASGTIQKLTPVKNISIKNAIIIGPSGNDELIGLRIRVGIACLIENIRSSDIDKIHIQLTDCVFSKVTKCHLNESNHSNQGYGISFADSCQDCTAINNSFVNVRHSLTTNNNVSTSYGITRRILFTNNIVSDSATATGGTGGDAIDTHAGAEDIFIIGNTVNSSSNYGINFEARTGSVSNNFIKNTASGGININPRADNVSSVTISGNTLLAIGDAASEYGILISISAADIINCVVSGNRIVSFAQPIRAVNSSTFVLNKIVIAGNSIQKSSASTTLNGIDLTGAKLASVSGNSILAGSAGIILTDCNNSVVSGNSIEIINTTGSSGWGVRLSGSSSYVNVNGNSVYYSTSGITTTIGISFASTVTYSSSWSNITRGFTTPVNLSTGTGNLSANNI